MARCKYFKGYNLHLEHISYETGIDVNNYKLNHSKWNVAVMFSIKYKQVFRWYIGFLHFAYKFSRLY